ncbi:MAG TPA: molybdopterin-guanine dinucleotide biosynthesis protein B, partial [Bacillota bacterium]|nr:molybdopterin-guanine dinucleotide biosynthesis protein B [Bacillota bacterium]
MRVFSVFGITQSGKTTTIENIIRELRKRRYSVGSVKEIHFEKFAIDKEGTNTYRHRMAGSELVTARGYKETDILFQRMLSMDEILRFYHHDFVVLEGVTDCNVPKIVTARNTAEVDERLDDTVFAISGRIANDL